MTPAKGDLVAHPQNGEQLRLVLGVDSLRGESVMQVGWALYKRSGWIVTTGWTVVRRAPPRIDADQLENS